MWDLIIACCLMHVLLRVTGSCRRPKPHKLYIYGIYTVYIRTISRARLMRLRSYYTIKYIVSQNSRGQFWTLETMPNCATFCRTKRLNTRDLFVSFNIHLYSGLNVRNGRIVFIVPTASAFALNDRTRANVVRVRSQIMHPHRQSRKIAKPQTQWNVAHSAATARPSVAQILNNFICIIPTAKYAIHGLRNVSKTVPMLHATCHEKHATHARIVVCNEHGLGEHALRAV